MKEISIEELKSVQLDILDFIDKFCKQHAIKYFLVGGTLIGAVRHKGFIPWDDDIDICLLREDYDRFIKLFREENNPVYRVYSHSIQKDYPFPYAKVSNEKTLLKEEDVIYSYDLGVNIDVFPFDNIPNEDGLQKRLYRKFWLYYGMLQMKQLLWSPQRSLLKNVFAIVSRYILEPVPYSFIVKKMHENAIQYKNKDCILCGDVVWGYGIREITQKEYFEEAIYSKFEGREYPIPKGYDQYLRKVYGDYMQFPPLDKQVTHHGFVAYWK